MRVEGCPAGHSLVSSHHTSYFTTFPLAPQSGSFPRTGNVSIYTVLGTYCANHCSQFPEQCRHIIDVQEIATGSVSVRVSHLSSSSQLFWKDGLGTWLSGLDTLAPNL